MWTPFLSSSVDPTPLATGIAVDDKTGIAMICSAVPNVDDRERGEVPYPMVLPDENV